MANVWPLRPRDDDAAVRHWRVQPFESYELYTSSVFPRHILHNNNIVS